MDSKAIIDKWNAARKAHKNRWYIATLYADDNMCIRIKSYNTWVQRFEVTYSDSTRHSYIDSNCGDSSVASATSWLCDSLSSITLQ